MNLINSEFPDPVVCVTHADIDGHCAAALVKKKYPHARIIVSNYGKDTPDYAFVQGGKLFVTDFSLTPIEFEKARRRGMQIIWIDHHKARIDELQSQGFNFEGLRSGDRCGAMLTHEYLFPGKPVPEFVKLVNDYDMWSFRDGRTMGFIEGMRLMETRAAFKSCYIWDMLYNDVDGRILSNVVSMGNRIHEYLALRNKVACEELAYRTVFNGANVLVANTKQSNSTFFDGADKTGLNAVCLIQYSPTIGKYLGSFYSPDNIQETLPLAKMLDGGGHPKACGFRTMPYPFQRPVYNEAQVDLAKQIFEYAHVLRKTDDPIVRQAAIKSAHISLTTATWTDKWRGGKSCIKINYPYLTELVGSVPHVKDLVNPDTVEVTECIISFCLTKNGLYRYGLWYTDRANDANRGKDYLTNLYKDCLVGDIFCESTPYGFVWHWYSKEMIGNLPSSGFQ